jgi:hypothetical protein
MRVMYGFLQSQVTLLDSSVVTLEIFDTYNEAGATAVDVQDGVSYTVAVRVSSAVNTSAVSPPGAPYQVAYSATDAAGNTALAVREVAVVDSCAASGEFRCPDTKKW